ncbi:MAG TPA: hypothetical protein VMP86_08850 [Candidatus Binatia bacterium]|nr:hypothetical protein [Candidatus Binatia bacterium]
MIRSIRLALSLLSLVVIMAVPARVAACSCMEQLLADAVRGADVAFVGTVSGTDRPVPAAFQPGADEITWSWEVERSRDVLESNRIDLVAWPDDGANCGVSFGVGERWLVIAHGVEGRLSSSSCSMNQRMDDVEPPVAAEIESMLTVAPPAEPAEAGAGSVAPSPPILFMGAAIAVVAAVSGWAFLRRRA